MPTCPECGQRVGLQFNTTNARGETVRVTPCPSCKKNHEEAI